MVDSDEKRRQVAELYASLTEEELKGLAAEAWTLTEMGKEILQAELTRRALVFELAPAAPQETELSNLVILRQYRDLPESLLAQSFLESNGIESFLVDATTIRMDWLWSNLLGGIKLCVNPEDAEAASQLLNQEIPEKFNVEGVGEFEQPRCPQCQSLNISFADLDKPASYVSTFLLNAPIPISRRRWKCGSCGHTWQPPGLESKPTS